MTFPQSQRSFLPTTTIAPQDREEFVKYWNRLYEQMASAINSRDFVFFPMAISDIAQPIFQLPNFGAYIICISGVSSSLPTLTASLCKADAQAAGSVASLGSQVGTGDWAGIALTITTSATNFLISHNRTNNSGNFNIRIIGTQ